jgi:hypothetical protein
VVEGLDVTSMEGDGGHAEVGVEGIDTELMGGRPAGLANLVGIVKGLGDCGVARVGNRNIGGGGRHWESAGEAGRVVGMELVCWIVFQLSLYPWFLS